MIDDKLVIAGIEFKSRLWVGTGKYKDFEETRKASEASGTDVVTVSVRRVNIIDRSKENLLDYIDPKKYKILPNTAGCYTADEAVRTARLAQAAGITNLVKLEVIGDQDGDGMRRCLDEYRHRGCAGSDRDGGSDEIRGLGRPAGVQGGTDSKK